MEMKIDYLKNHICTCPKCNKKIKGIKNQEEQVCPFCGYEFELDFTVRAVE